MLFEISGSLSKTPSISTPKIFFEKFQTVILIHLQKQAAQTIHLEYQMKSLQSVGKLTQILGCVTFVQKFSEPSSNGHNQQNLGGIITTVSLYVLETVFLNFKELRN